VADGDRSVVLVVGVGNVARRDDGAGIAVARHLRPCAPRTGIEVREEHGEPVGLIDGWQGFGAVLVVDAMRSGAVPGTLRRFEATSGPLPRALRRSASTHAIALSETIELARALDRLPPHLLVFAVEGQRFDAGTRLSPAVAAAVPSVAGAVLDEARMLAATPRSGPPAHDQRVQEGLRGGEPIRGLLPDR
jgi:hydrogenase maturation protease